MVQVVFKKCIENVRSKQKRSLNEQDIQLAQKQKGLCL